MWLNNLTAGVYPEETIVEKDTCTPMFIQHYLQELGYGSNLDVHQQMDKEIVVPIYNGILLSYEKKCIWVSSNEVDEPRA